MNCFIVWGADEKMKAVWAKDETELMTHIEMWVPGAIKWQDLGNGEPYGYARKIEKPDLPSVANRPIGKLVTVENPERFNAEVKEFRRRNIENANKKYVKSHNESHPLPDFG